MRRDILITQSFSQVSRDPLSHAARVDEHERRLVLANQRGHPVVDFFPNFVRHDRFQRRTGNFDRQIELARVASVYNRATWGAVAGKIRSANQKASHLYYRFLRRRKPDAHQRLFDQRLKSFD